MISAAENYPKDHTKILNEIKELSEKSETPILGVTGTGGSGKSSLVDEFVRRFILDFPKKKIAIISVDPSKRKTGGALLGDRIRMNAIKSDNVYMRSLATRQANLALSAHVNDALDILKVSGSELSTQGSPYTSAVLSDCTSGSVAETIGPFGEVLPKLNPLASVGTFW